VSGLSSAEKKRMVQQSSGKRWYLSKEFVRVARQASIGDLSMLDDTALLTPTRLYRHVYGHVKRISGKRKFWKDVKSWQAARSFPKVIHLSIGKFSKDLESSLPPVKNLLLICSASSPAAIVAADVGKSTTQSVKWKG
jgi:hypothetical protein